MATLIDTDDRRQIYPDVTVVARAPAPNEYGYTWSIVAYPDGAGMWTWFVGAQRGHGDIYYRNETMHFSQLPTLEALRERALADGYVLAA